MVSILIPAYNAEKTLQRCLNSVCKQTYKDIEVIVVNDGSVDGTVDIAEKIAAEHSFIRIISQKNMGVAAARNVCLKEANGDYILFVDADDWIEPDMIERMLVLCGDADIVFCANDHAEAPIDVVHEEYESQEKWDHDRQICEFIKHKKMSGMLWNKLMCRRLTKGVAFNEKTGYGEDAEFLWQILQKSKSMLVTNKVLYHHVLEKNSITQLAYSEKKYSAIPMWEKINADVERNYPQLRELARVSLASAAVYGLFEAQQSAYRNRAHLNHMRLIVRKNIVLLLKADYLSAKFKAYALFLCLS